MLRADAVSVTAGASTLLHAVSLTVEAGELVALVGPNGAGKSTLLAALSGDRALASGSVTMDGKPMGLWRPRDLARRRAVMTQRHEVAFGFTAGEVVAMARHPWSGDRSDDQSAVADSLAQLGVLHLADRVYPTLSGGEQSRVVLARCLAQGAPLLLLDEPTAALDLKHQEEVLSLVREHAHAGGAAVVVIHDLTLAGAYADRIVMLDAGRVVADGAPERVLTAGLVGRVYGLTVDVHEAPSGPVVVPRRSPRTAPPTSC